MGMLRHGRTRSDAKAEIMGRPQFRHWWDNCYVQEGVRLSREGLPRFLFLIVTDLHVEVQSKIREDQGGTIPERWEELWD